MLGAVNYVCAVDNCVISEITVMKELVLCLSHVCLNGMGWKWDFICDGYVDACACI